MAFSNSIHGPAKNWALKLPREHGAVAVFSLATLVSLWLCRTDVTLVSGALILLWLMTLSAHDETLLFCITALSMLLMCVTGHVPVALFFLLTFLGIGITERSSRTEDLWWREIVGLSGAALVPLAIAFLISGNFQPIFIASLAFLASIMTGLALIHGSRPELKISPLLSAGCSLLLWISLAAMSSILAAVSLFPFCIQVVWIWKRKKPNFRELGLAQAISMACVCLAICVLL